MKTLLAAFAIAMAATTASAETVVVQFTGEVVIVGDFGVDVGSVFSVGDPIVGTFTYDNQTPSSTTTTNGAVFDAAITAMNVNIDGYFFSLGAGANSIATENDHIVLGDYTCFCAEDPSGLPVDGLPLSSVQLELIDGDNAVFVDDASAMSLTPTYNFSEFETGRLLIEIVNEDDIRERGQVSGTLTNFTIIPEPASFVLLAIGAGAALIHRS